MKLKGLEIGQVFTHYGAYFSQSNRDVIEFGAGWNNGGGNCIQLSRRNSEIINDFALRHNISNSDISTYSEIKYSLIPIRDQSEFHNTGFNEIVVFGLVIDNQKVLLMEVMATLKSYEECRKFIEDYSK